MVWGRDSDADTSRLLTWDVATGEVRSSTTVNALDLQHVVAVGSRFVVACSASGPVLIDLQAGATTRLDAALGDVNAHVCDVREFADGAVALVTTRPMEDSPTSSTATARCARRTGSTALLRTRLLTRRSWPARPVSSWQPPPLRPRSPRDPMGGPSSGTQGATSSSNGVYKSGGSLPRAYPVRSCAPSRYPLPPWMPPPNSTSGELRVHSAGSPQTAPWGGRRTGPACGSKTPRAKRCGNRIERDWSRYRTGVSSRSTGTQRSLSGHPQLFRPTAHAVPETGACAPSKND